MRSRAQQRRHSETGMAILELSMVMVVLVAAVGVIFDYGQAWRTGLMVNEAARSATRVGSALGPRAEPYPTDSDPVVMVGRTADYQALSSAKAALKSAGKLDDVIRVVIFKAPASGKLPDSCKAGTGPSCNIVPGPALATDWDLSGDALDATSADGCVSIMSSCNWAPTARQTDQATADYFGVWVQVRHDYLFPAAGDHAVIARTSVMRIEPKVKH